MRLHYMIFKAIRALLALNARVYGKGASYEVCNDLAGEFYPYGE